MITQETQLCKYPCTRHLTWNTRSTLSYVGMAVTITHLSAHEHATSFHATILCRCWLSICLLDIDAWACVYTCVCMYVCVFSIPMCEIFLYVKNVIPRLPASKRYLSWPYYFFGFFSGWFSLVAWVQLIEDSCRSNQNRL